MRSSRIRMALIGAWLSPSLMAAQTALPEIVVTAQKTEQSIEDVPVSVSTLDGELVNQSGATGITDLQGYAGNVVLQLAPDGGRFTMRGFGTPASNPGFEPSVASVVDGVYYGRPVFLSAFFFDIDRIEVLRGPQGTLFGKNATAGLLNVATRAPQTQGEASVDVFYNDLHQVLVRPVLNAALGEDFSLRLSGAYGDDPGVLYNTTLDRPETNRRQGSTRLRMRYAPDAHWSLALDAFHADIDRNNNDIQLSHASQTMLAAIRQYDPDAENSARNFDLNANVPARVDTQLDGVSGTLDVGLDGLLDIDTLTLTTIASWARHLLRQRDIDADFSAMPVIRDSLVQASPYSQQSFELRFAGHHRDLFGWGHGFDFVFGGYYYGSRLSANDLFSLEDLGAAASYLLAAQLGQNEAAPLGGAIAGVFGPLSMPLATILNTVEPLLAPLIGSEQSAFVSLDQFASTGAFFGQFEHFVLPGWAIIGGLRVSREFKQGEFSSQAQGALIPLIADQEDHQTHITRAETDLSPKAGLKWQASERTNTYFTWSRGFKSGGFNALPLNPDNLEYEPERASSYEVGVKSRLLGGSMRVSAAAFDTRFEKLQVSTFQGGSFIILNAAAARSRGAEADLQWLLPLPGVALYTSLGYADAIYTRYPDAPAPATAENSTQDLAGKRLSVAPRITAAVVPSYTTYLPWFGMTTTLALDWLYRGDRYLDVDLDPNTYQPATTELNARLSIGAQSGRWLINLAARNLGNEFILEQVLDQPLAPGNYAAIRGDRGRVLSASLLLNL